MQLHLTDSLATKTDEEQLGATYDERVGYDSGSRRKSTDFF
jgi:hypothetical protein